jgi:hypothetical protein
MEWPQLPVGSPDDRLRLRQRHPPLDRILPRLAGELWGGDPKRASRVAAQYMAP